MARRHADRTGGARRSAWALSLPLLRRRLRPLRRPCRARVPRSHALLGRRLREDVSRAAQHESRVDLVAGHGSQLWMIEVDHGIRPRCKAEGGRAFGSADREQLGDRDHAADAGLPAADALQLTELFDRIDPDMRVGPDTKADRPVPNARDWEEAVAEVGLGRRADADSRAGLAQEVELIAIRVRRVDDGRPRPQAALAGQELDRADTFLREAFLDLARL